MSSRDESQSQSFVDSIKLSLTSLSLFNVETMRVMRLRQENEVSFQREK